MRMPRASVCSLCAVCVVALRSCAPSVRAQPDARQQGEEREAAWRAKPVVTFAGGQLTAGELSDALQSQDPFLQQRYATLEGVRAVLERNLRAELLAQEAQRRGYAQHPDVVAAQRQSAVYALLRQDFDDPDAERAIRAEDIRSYYEAHLSEYTRPEGRRASVLILEPKPGESGQDETLLAQAKAADMRVFRELVRTHSIDPSNTQRGGDLTYFTAEGALLDSDGKVDPEIARTAFSLPHVGDTSEPFALGEYRAILKLTGMRPAQDAPFATLQDRLRSSLWRERRQVAIDAHVAELKKRTKTFVHSELVDIVQLDDGPPLPPSGGLPSDFPHIRTDSRSGDKPMTTEQP
jgi:hypothetical protein